MGGYTALLGNYLAKLRQLTSLFGSGSEFRGVLRLASILEQSAKPKREFSSFLEKFDAKFEETKESVEDAGDKVFPVPCSVCTLFRMYPVLRAQFRVCLVPFVPVPYVPSSMFT
jgi:hypothetical protein